MVDTKTGAIIPYNLGQGTVFVYTMEYIEKLERELEEFKQSIIKSISDFMNSKPTELTYVVYKKDHIKLEGTPRGASINIQPIVVFGQSTKLISPSVVIGDVIAWIRNQGLEIDGYEYGYTVLKKTMQCFSGGEFIDWLIGNGIKMSDDVAKVIGRYGDSIKTSCWRKEFWTGVNELIYNDSVIISK